MFIWSKHFGLCRETNEYMLPHAVVTDFEIELSVNRSSYADGFKQVYLNVPVILFDIFL